MNKGNMILTDNIKINKGKQEEEKDDDGDDVNIDDSSDDDDDSYIKPTQSQ